MNVIRGLVLAMLLAVSGIAAAQTQNVIQEIPGGTAFGSVTICCGSSPTQSQVHWTGIQWYDGTFQAIDDWVTGWVEGNIMHISLYIDGIYAHVTVDMTTGETADVTGSTSSEGWAVALWDDSIDMTESALLPPWPVYYSGW